VHPAKSVIFFTTASGAGYGLVAWLALLGSFGFLPADRGLGIVSFGIGITLIVAGLLSSTLHLGHPERAWRALSQWRSSWLSREGVAAIAAFAPIGAYALSWILLGQNSGWAGFIGAIAVIASMATVYCTSMIYASLKSIPAWSNQWTPRTYIVLSLATGGVIATLLFSVWGLAISRAWMLAAAALLIVGLIVKILYWRSVDEAPPRSTAESATGLGAFGAVRLIDAPHSQSNYLLEEMGFKIARKHAAKLRRISIIAGFLIPTALLTTAALSSTAPLLLAFLAISVGAIGIIAERWLFFAEAKHVVMLYYGENKI
jgi:DMSO reductase anchor subunit